VKISQKEIGGVGEKFDYYFPAEGGPNLAGLAPGADVRRLR